MSDSRRPGTRTSRNVVVTGASSGIGLAAAELLAAQGMHVVLVGRHEQRLAAAVERVRAAGQGHEPGWFRADFQRLDDVHKLAGHLLSSGPGIDVLVNNAGQLVPSYWRTGDGHEATIQVNHLAPFLLSHLLREHLGGGRIITTSVRPGPNARLDPDDLDSFSQRYRSFAAYQSSKAANILFAMEAAQRWPDILSISLHPGLVRTDIGRDTPARHFFRHAPFLISPQVSARRIVRLVTAPAEELSNGGFYDNDRLRPPRRALFSPEAAARLWVTSERAVRETGR